MACPQKENGYIPIATEIVRAMQRTYWTSYEVRIVFCIFEKTYGWHKKEDWIALSQLSKMTGILPQHISRTISLLLKRNIIKKNGKKIGFNKDYEKWAEITVNHNIKNIPNRVIPNRVIGVTKRGIKNIPNRVTTIDTTKDTIQKTGGIHSFSLWDKELRRHRASGGQTRGRKKLIIVRGVKKLLDEFGNWEKYNSKEYLLTLKNKNNGNISTNQRQN